MPPGEALDDDYVVSLLVKDAEANRKQYLTNGNFGSLLSSKARGNAPKPNTRFLKSIIRETDSHNAALKAKEEQESRTRLRELKREQSAGKRRRHGDEHEEVPKRRRTDDKPTRWANALGGLGASSTRRHKDRQDERPQRDEEASTHHHRDRRRHPTEREKSDRHRRAEHDRRNRRDRRSSPDHRKGHRRRQRSRSPRRSPLAENTMRSDPRVHEHRSEDSDSDPLDDLLGPHPPPQTLPRGRGAHKPTSTMDARFEAGYDPKADVDLSPDDEDRDDWDMALEALRDRAKWRVQGADRLRAAGFTDEEVSKWEKGGEKDVQDVRWRKNGEGREWDRGKVMMEDGVVESGPEWGRLKNT